MYIVKTLSLLLIVILGTFNNKLIAQEKDSIFMIADDDWSNVEKFTEIIHMKIDSVIKTNKIDSICGDLIICFTIGENGKVDSCMIKKSINKEIDSLMIKVFCELDFKKAVVYSATGKPYSINFSFPIKFHLCGKKND